MVFEKIRAMMIVKLCFMFIRVENARVQWSKMQYVNPNKIFPIKNEFDFQVHQSKARLGT